MFLKTARNVGLAALPFYLLWLVFQVLLLVHIGHGPDWSCRKDSDGAQEVENGQYQCTDDGTFRLRSLWKCVCARAHFPSASPHQTTNCTSKYLHTSVPNH